VISLATPHQPVVVMDYYTRKFYDGVDAAFNLRKNTTGNDFNVSFVSIGGGDRDVQVRLSTNQSSIFV
jgi:hypothetical protein